MADSESDYDVGQILEGSWGYDQTNIDFYRVDRRTNDTLWLRPLGQRKVPGSDGFMSESVVPDEPLEGAELVRRKLIRDRDGRPIGCRYTSSYGWISAWNGRPAYQSHYA